jgi:hypothetical protein
MGVPGCQIEAFAPQALGLQWRQRTATVSRIATRDSFRMRSLPSPLPICCGHDKKCDQDDVAVEGAWSLQIATDGKSKIVEVEIFCPKLYL